MLGIDESSFLMAMMTHLRDRAAYDLAQILSASHIPLRVSHSRIGWLPAIRNGEIIEDEPPPAFHFGRHLGWRIRHHKLDEVWYFGSASAPFLNAEMIAEIEKLIDNPNPTLITNNVHSADWFVFNHSDRALPILKKAERDNGVAWQLREFAGYQTHVLSEKYPALKLDLDTPADFALIGQHPACPPHLKRAIAETSRLKNIPIEPVLNVLRREGSHVLVAGRVSPSAWQNLSSATRVWIRVLGEERGMVANGRMVRGEVQSILGYLLQTQGPSQFVASLSAMADAAILDSRVLMAHMGEFPSPVERFASDLGELDLIKTPWLRELTEAIHNAPIPILLGGHSVVAGGLDILTSLI